MKNILYGVGLVALIGIGFLVMAADQNGARAYMSKNGYEVSVFEREVFQISCSAGKNRSKFVFKAHKNGQEVHGYLCYGALYPASIHLD